MIISHLTLPACGRFSQNGKWHRKKEVFEKGRLNGVVVSYHSNGKEAEKARYVYGSIVGEWVKTFDCWNYMIDRWDLLNPPGINYVDHDPNDDNPFNNKDM